MYRTYREVYVQYTKTTKDADGATFQSLMDDACMYFGASPERWEVMLDDGNTINSQKMDNLQNVSRITFFAPPVA